MTVALSQLRFADIVHAARSRNASDVHFAGETAPALRIDGDLEFLSGGPMSEQDVRATAAAMLGEAQLSRIEAGEDVSVTCSSDEFGPLRAHGFRSAGNIALSLRLLNKTVPALETLHVPAAVAALTERDRGLVLFAGPTGSGKSTTLAAVVDRINSTAARRIITVEDPVEYRHVNKRSLIAQRDVGADTVSFQRAVIGALRADPDVIVIGEMRDQETMQAALTAAETGHLVLATIHTGDAVQTVDRIVDAFSGAAQAHVRSQLAQSLAAVVCQRLVRRASGPGRRVVAEVLIASDAVRNLIREGKTHQLHNAMLTGREAGMQTFGQHAADLIAQREIAAISGMTAWS